MSLLKPSKDSAAIAFAYGDMMIERLQPLHNCDLDDSVLYLRGQSLNAMKYYAQARLCKILKQQMYEGRIYDENGKFSLEALKAWLKDFEQSLAVSYNFDPLQTDAQASAFTEAQKIDYAFWDAARVMQTWGYVA